MTVAVNVPSRVDTEIVDKPAPGGPWTTGGAEVGLGVGLGVGVGVEVEVGTGVRVGLGARVAAGTGGAETEAA